MIRILRPAPVGRVAVGDAAVPVLAIVPVAPAHAAIRLAVGHQAATLRTRRILRRAVRVVVAGVPVVDELPDVASHVIETVAVDAVSRLVRLLAPRPAEVRLAMRLAVEKPHRRRPRLRAGTVWVLRLRP